MRLTKWYLDVVDPRGHAAVLYHVTVRAGPVSIRAASVLWREAGAVVYDRTTLISGRGPAVINDARGRWICSGLDLHAGWRAESPPIVASLGDDRSARLAWRCVAPAAWVTLELGDHRLEGDGYVERLELAGSLHRLPINELRWGRFVAEECGGVRSLVWIDWRGPAPLQLAWLDGQPLDVISCSEDGVRSAMRGSEVTLSIAGGGTLRDGLVRPSLGPLGVVPGVVPRRVMDATERKWIARGQLRVVGMPGPVRGWVIHELVRFGDPAARREPLAMRHALEAS